jgi:hypothetical protein
MNSIPEWALEPQPIELSEEALAKIYELLNNLPRPPPRLREAARRQRILRTSTMNESDYISAIAEWLRSARVTVHLYAHNLPHFGGLYRSETRTIWINVPDARGALLTLAHEAGHVMGYVCHRNNDKRPALFRERQAYVYGWYVLKLFGADRIISRTEWIRECKESHVEFMKPEAYEVFAAATAHADAEIRKLITGSSLIPDGAGYASSAIIHEVQRKRKTLRRRCIRESLAPPNSAFDPHRPRPLTSSE